MRRRQPTPLVRFVAALGLMALSVFAMGATATATDLVYAPSTAADAIHDNGDPTALRQAPIAEFLDPRWPVERRVGKVSGRTLAGMSAAAMEHALRAGWVRHPVGGAVGGYVGVDEISPSAWGPRPTARLATALAALGPDAHRVIFYVAPALVERVGRTDPRQGLRPDVRAIATTLMNGGGQVYLEVYRGDLTPFPAREMAIHTTRWLARWPVGRESNLHVLIGPGVAVPQAEIWNRIRATPAGRRILANGPGYYAPLRHASAADGAAWAAQLAAFRANPDAAPPGGDYRVPTGGDLVLRPPTRSLLPGGVLRFTTNRAGKAVVRLITASGKVRIIKGSLRVSASGKAVITLPRDLRPGAYTVRVSFLGEGLRDEATVPLRIAAAPTRGDRAARGFRERLLEGQRVSQDAVRLLNAIQAWLDAGIVTGDLAAGGFGAQYVASGATAAFAPSVTLGRGNTGAAPEAASPRPITPAPSKGATGTVRVSPVQLLINQRISQAAVARANALDARLTGGLTGGDLADGAITPGKLAPGVVVTAAPPEARPAPSQSTTAPIARKGAKGLRVTDAQLTINLRISQAALDRARALSGRLTSGLGEGDFRAGSVVASNLAPQSRGAMSVDAP